MVRRFLSLLDKEELDALSAAMDHGRGGDMKGVMRDFVASCERRLGRNPGKALNDFDALCEARREVA